jgi:hypothetical protein
MAKRKVATALLVALGSIGGAVFWRRRARRSREHVDLYFVDGSMVSFPEGSPEATRLLSIARRILTQAR